MHKILITAAGLALGGIVASAQARQVWLEQAEGESAAMLRFGEFGKKLHAAGQGREACDSVSYLASLTYVKPDGVQPLAARKAAAPHK